MAEDTNGTWPNNNESQPTQPQDANSAQSAPTQPTTALPQQNAPSDDIPTSAIDPSVNPFMTSEPAAQQTAAQQPAAQPVVVQSAEAPTPASAEPTSQPTATESAKTAAPTPAESEPQQTPAPAASSDDAFLNTSTNTSTQYRQPVADAAFPQDSRPTQAMPSVADAATDSQRTETLPNVEAPEGAGVAPAQSQAAQPSPFNPQSQNVSAQPAAQQPVQPQPDTQSPASQPLYRPAPEYGAYGPVPQQQPQPQTSQPQQPAPANGNPFAARQQQPNPFGSPQGPQGPQFPFGQNAGASSNGQPENFTTAARTRGGVSGHVVTGVVSALVAAALCLGVGYSALTYGWITVPTASSSSLADVSSNKSGTGTATAKTGEAADWKTVASEVSNSVVSIQTALSNGTAKGSGAIVDAKGYIVTNNHVISGAQQIQVTLSNGQMYTAQVVGTDTTTDLAVIKLDNPPSDLKAVEFADSDKLAVGEDVMAIGNPLGYDDTATTGIVSALNRPVTVTDDSGSDIVTNAVQIDAAINPGNSGGPTFNAAGQVIGINSSIASTATSSDSAGSIGIGFAIPSNLVKRVANEIIKDGKAKHVALGVTITTATVEADGVTRSGAKVTNPSSGSAVVSGSPADKAGLKVDDVIVAYNGNAVSSTYSLLGYVRASSYGEKVTLTIVRGGKTMDVSVTLDKEESAVNGSSSSNGNSNGNSQNNNNNNNNGNGNGSNGYGNGNSQNGDGSGNGYDDGGFSDPFGLW